MKHVILDINTNPNQWKCLHCGESIEQPPYLKINTAINLMNAFYKSHKKCKSQTPKSETVRQKEESCS